MILRRLIDVTLPVHILRADLAADIDARRSPTHRAGCALAPSCEQSINRRRRRLAETGQPRDRARNVGLNRRIDRPSVLEAKVLELSMTAGS
jgi:hypothetical protein